MSLTRGALKNFYEDLTPYVVETIRQFKERPSVYSAFLNVKSTDAGWVDINTISQHSPWTEKAELADAGKDFVIQGPTARAQVLTYAQRSSISDEAIEDDNGESKAAEMLPPILRAGRATQEILGHDLLNAGFSTTLTPDGLSLFNASHVGIDGTTQDNVFATDLVDSELELAITAIEEQKDDRGLPIMQMARTLVVHPNNKWNAMKILGTPNVMGSNNNDISLLPGQGINLVVSPFITDADSWFLLADEHALNWFWRRQVQNWSEIDYVNGSLEIGASFRCVAAAHDWHGTIGSPGA